MTDEPTGTVIEIDELDFAYPGARNLFENLSQEFVAGRFYLITGPSGAGKSTLLRLIIRLEEPTAGHIRFMGRRLTDYPVARLRRTVLYVQQTPTVAAGSVKDNLLLPFTFRVNRDLPVPDDEKLSGQLRRFLLEDIGLDTDAQTLSVGQLQRLCLIRGLLLEPKVVMLDEPASALDETSRKVVEDTAEQLCDGRGLTVIMVSHRRFEPGLVTPVHLRIHKAAVERVK